VGHPVPHPDVPLLAALLACGERVYISHVSALALWELVRAPITEVEVTAVGWNCRSRPGIRVHRVGALHPLDRESAPASP